MFNIMIGTLIYLCFIGENISVLIRDYPKLVVVGFGFQFSLLACKMQMSTIGKTSFDQFTRGSLISIGLIHLSLLLSFNMKIIPLYMFDYALGLALAINTITWFKFGYNLAHELSDILNVNILTVGKKKLN